MDLEKIRKEYEDFLEYFNETYSILPYVITDLDNYLTKYRKDCYYEIFTDNMEINLANLKEIFSKMDKIFELTENITLLETQIPKAAIYEMDNYIKIPDDYEDDICVALEDLPKLKDLSDVSELY